MKKNLTWGYIIMEKQVDCIITSVSLVKYDHKSLSAFT